MVGRRTNIFLPFPSMSRTDRTSNDQLIEAACQKGQLFQTDAEDYFIFTPATFRWSMLKDVVIGRPGYDNYLVTQIFKMSSMVSFLDLTNAVLVAHQTDAGGVKAGHRANPDRMWNMRRIKSDWQKGRTEYSWWMVEQFPRGVFYVHERYAFRDIPWDDRWLAEEWNVLVPHIPREASCLQFARAAVHGMWRQFCKELTVVVFKDNHAR